VLIQAHGSKFAKFAIALNTRSALRVSFAATSDYQADGLYIYSKHTLAGCPALIGAVWSPWTSLALDSGLLGSRERQFLRDMLERAALALSGVQDTTTEHATNSPQALSA
jgi:hypothetical protein